jgi:hypothetical protein
MAIELGINSVILETDALLVQQVVAEDNRSLSSSAGLVRELKELAYLNFGSFRCLFQRRECNRVAHALAIGCECTEGDNPIVDVLPSCIQVIVADDLSASE